MVLSIYFLISSNELVSFYFVLEFQSICLYVLAAFNRKHKSSLEAGIKYFILGSFSSIILLLGFSFIYAVSGLTHLEDLFIYFMTFNVTNTQSLLIDLSIVLIGSAFFFKIYAAPFHFWIADIYQGAPTSSMIFFATVPLISLFFILLKFYLIIFYNFMDIWKYFAFLTCLFSLVVGTLGALYQQYIKRLLAYSSIANVGFIISSFLFDNPFMYQHAFNYILLYSINLLGLISIFLNLHIKNKRVFLENLSLLAGLFKQNKVISIYIMVLLYSVAGLPPFSFFFGKIFLLTSLSNSSFYYIVYPIIAATLIGSFYYLRIVQLISYNSYNSWLLLSRISYIVLFNVFLIILFNSMYLFNYSTINVLTYYIVLDLYL
jgi:NADH-quinone oxidoreductase subunit N